MRLFIGIVFLLFSLVTLFLGMLLAQGERDILAKTNLYAATLFIFSAYFFFSSFLHSKREQRRRQQREQRSPEKSNESS